MFHYRKRRHKRTGRKDRLIQTRVGEQLEQEIKAEAKRRRITVSHLLRNVLEDYFNLVDDVVEEAENLPPEDDAPPKNHLSHIYAWNKVVVSQKVLCSICNGSIEEGQEGYVGLSDEARRDRAWLCKSCIDKI